MDSLIKQMRVRFSGVGEESKEGSSNIRDQRIQPQSTQSFKGEKQRSQNWFQRQFSRQMSRDYDSSDNAEYSTAVAAAAAAINSLRESNISDQKKKSDGPYTSFTEIKSEAPMKNSEVQDKRVPIRAATMEKLPEKAVGPTPSIRKTPTFPDKQLNNSATTKADSAAPKQDLPFTKQSSFPTNEFRRQSSANLGVEETDADVWEKTKIAKIKKRYEKVKAKILDWETKKKTKAKRRMERKESELERRRAKAIKHHRSEMERINQIADGARAQAVANQRNEEFKVKEKANKIRSTGKFPATCFCF